MEIKENCDFESKYIFVKPDRIFIDICKSGCGSGCSYCYAPKHNESQVLLDINEIMLICKYIKERYDCKKRIISLCPNTEPLKSKSSMKLVLYIVRYFSNLGGIVQISTKEKIPITLLENINSIENACVYFNISVPTITSAGTIEPFASPVKDRFSNFDFIGKYEKITFCLYIKPFFARKKDYEMYVKIINDYRIQNICVGPLFLNNEEVPCTSLYTKKTVEKIYDEQLHNILLFSKLVRDRTEAKVYNSSICCIYNKYFKQCVLELFYCDASLCKDCILKGV